MSANLFRGFFRGTHYKKVWLTTRVCACAMLVLVLALSGCGGGATVSGSGATVSGGGAPLDDSVRKYANDTLTESVSRLTSEIELADHLIETVTPEELGDRAYLLDEQKTERAAAADFLNNSLKPAAEIAVQGIESSAPFGEKEIDEFKQLQADYYKYGAALAFINIKIWDTEELYWEEHGGEAEASATKQAFYAIDNDTVVQLADTKSDSDVEKHNGSVKGGFAVFYTWGTITDNDVSGWGHHISWKGGGLGFGGFGGACVIERFKERSKDWTDMLNQLKIIGVGGFGDNEIDLETSKSVYLGTINTPDKSMIIGGAGGKAKVTD